MSKSSLTPQKKDFSAWYTDVCKLADLVDNGPVKGTMIIKPYGYAIWENIQKIFDGMIKSKGIKNGYFPIFIPESFLNKESEHVEGFTPELAVVTFAGGEELTEKVIVRPTSETIIYDSFSKWISSYRDLPYHINQWCNVVRWEKRTKPFIRTTEFLWQEGHSALRSAKEVDALTIDRLNEYEKLFNEALAMAPFIGKKSEKEKFAGAIYSTSCEALLKDGKALQSATSHNLGQNFSKPFNVMYENEKGRREYVWQSSWGLSTRVIGGLILTHGDDNGLVLPPLVAPIQVVIIPVYKNDDDKITLQKTIDIITKKLDKSEIRYEIDTRDNLSFGWKSTEWEIKGVPIRVEIGPKDIKNDSVVIVERDINIKTSLKINKIDFVNLLLKIQNRMYMKAKDYRDSHTYVVKEFNELSKNIDKNKGFYLAPWCGETPCEEAIKEKTKASTRVIPLKTEKLNSNKCFHCGKKAKTMVYFAKAY